MAYQPAQQEPCVRVYIEVKTHETGYLVGYFMCHGDVKAHTLHYGNRPITLPVFDAREVMVQVHMHRVHSYPDASPLCHHGSRVEACNPLVHGYYR